MIIFDQEDASTAPNIMQFPFDFNDMCIEVCCFFIPLLKWKQQNR